MHEIERRGIWRIDRQQGDGIVVDAALLLIHAIAQRLILREDRRDWVLGRESLWRIDRLMAVLAVALWARETTPHQIEALLDWALLEAELGVPGRS